MLLSFLFIFSLGVLMFKRDLVMPEYWIGSDSDILNLKGRPPFSLKMTPLDQKNDVTRSINERKAIKQKEH